MEQPNNQDIVVWNFDDFNWDFLQPALASVDNTLVSEPVKDPLQVPVLALPVAVKSKPPPPPPASVKPRQMSPTDFKLHKNLINRKYRKNKKLEREQDKERIRTLEESLRREMLKSSVQERALLKLTIEVSTANFRETLFFSFFC